MKDLFDRVSQKCSKEITGSYSTSFSLGIFLLDHKLREPIYSIYGFVRLADEIVDSFHHYDQRLLLNQLESETYSAIKAGISLNPVLNSFQQAVNDYAIPAELIGGFFNSMKMDLECQHHNRRTFDEYIFGSAQVVGLMCLRVFCQGKEELYDDLEGAAMSLGAAFQKVNFLRDLRADYFSLKRVYFPGLDLGNFSSSQKSQIEAEIREDFDRALQGIRKLPAGARFGVYVAYVYYLALLNKIAKCPPRLLLCKRLRLANMHKYLLLLYSLLRYKLGRL